MRDGVSATGADAVLGQDELPEVASASRRCAPVIHLIAGARHVIAVRHLARYGILVAMVATFVVFSVLRPDSFFTLLTMKSILRDSSPLMLVAVGLTFILVMNEFDISVGGQVALAATVSIMLVSSKHVGVGTFAAVALTILISAGCGLANGLLVAYVRAPAFILTIGMSTVFTGVSLQLANSSTLYGGVPASFMSLANASALGLPTAVWISLAVAVVAQAFLTRTVWGRYMHAIGGNEPTATLSGIRVARFKTAGFVMVGVTAALSAILLTAQVGADNPNTGVGQLLPAYAAAFLGSSMFRAGVFSAIGSAIGALYLQMIATGLTIFNFSGPLVQIVQGGILAGAILLARFAK